MISAIPIPGKHPREIFVAYPYRVYAQADYRKLFTNVGRALDVQFTFADEQISSTYVLEKIRAMIQIAQFGVYDISAWNPNVSLELGLALGMNEKTFISFNPAQGDLSEVPADSVEEIACNIHRTTSTSNRSLGWLVRSCRFRNGSH